VVALVVLVILLLLLLGKRLISQDHRSSLATVPRTPFTANWIR